MSEDQKSDEIKSLNPEKLDVDALSADALDQVSGGLADFTCGDFNCPGTFTCSTSFKVNNPEQGTGA
jgi:hypothetical protein